MLLNYSGIYLLIGYDGWYCIGIAFRFGVGRV